MEKIAIKKTQNKPMKLFASFLRRFHLIIFFVFVVACLAAAVILINETLAETTAETDALTTGSADEAIVQRIESHHTSDNPAEAPTLPNGRTNPFAE